MKWLYNKYELKRRSNIIVVNKFSFFESIRFSEVLSWSFFDKPS